MLIQGSWVEAGIHGNVSEMEGVTGIMPEKQSSPVNKVLSRGYGIGASSATG